MKKILITGANSYIGTSFENYIKSFDGYQIDTVDMIDGSWRNMDFSEYDTVFHVAGIAHRKETRKNAHLYYEVNRDLTIETAQKAKNDGVGQFVFLSSMSVYGLTTGRITLDTTPKPNSNYGKSKLEAENGLNILSDSTFHVAVIRPPMVYGEGCKGNYRMLKKFALSFPIFPDYKNERSMIEINNLCDKIKKIIDENGCGYFYPQDREYICTTDMVRDIAEKNNRNIYFTKIFNPFIKSFNINILNKVFGNLTYDKSM